MGGWREGGEERGKGGKGEERESEKERKKERKKERRKRDKEREFLLCFASFFFSSAGVGVFKQLLVWWNFPRF